MDVHSSFEFAATCGSSPHGELATCYSATLMILPNENVAALRHYVVTDKTTGPAVSDVGRCNRQLHNHQHRPLQTDLGRARGFSEGILERPQEPAVYH